MADSRATATLLPRGRGRVKALIAAEGITFGSLANAAGKSIATVSRTAGGELRSAKTQMAVWIAFCELTGSRITLADFWGDLLSERIRAA